MTLRLPPVIAEQIGSRQLIPIKDGQSGAAVFRIRDDGVDLFLKVGSGRSAASVADESARLAWLSGRVPCARVIATAEDEATAWLLTTALRGVTAGAYTKADRSRAATVAATVAGFMQRLHALPIAECPFDSSVDAWLPVVRRLVADKQIDTEDFDPEHTGWSAEEVLAKVEAFSDHAQGKVVVHGDFSLGNVIVDENDGTILGCIDVGLLGVGDPYRDIFIGWRDLGGFGPGAQSAFLAAIGLDALDADRRELHRALDELF